MKMTIAELENEIAKYDLRNVSVTLEQVMNELPKHRGNGEVMPFCDWLHMLHAEAILTKSMEGKN
jgi:hypothetical protein